MPATLRRVLVSQHSFDEDGISLLKAAGCEVVHPEATWTRGDGHFGRDELADHLRGVSGWILGHAQVTHDLLQAHPALLVLSRRGVGYDGVDVAAAAALGRVVAIAAGGNDDSVADHTMALILGVARRLRESQTRMCAGSWSILASSNLHGKTVGILGFGRIARRLVKRLSGFEATVLVAAGERHADAITAAGAHPVAWPALLAQSDVVTLHAPLTDDTRHIIDHAAIARMKPTAILVNTARGGLVDDADLLDALRAGRLAGAGLDVYRSEADPSVREVTEALIALPNVLATPHAAASSRESLARMNRIAVENVVAVLDGGTPSAACLVVDGRR